MTNPDGPRFEKVDQISSPGRFMLAHIGAPKTVISGQWPRWDYTLVGFLRRQYGDIEWIGREMIKEDDPSSEWEEYRIPWTGQSGRILIKGQQYRVRSGVHLQHPNEVEFSLITLNEQGQTEYEQPDYEIHGGLIEISQQFSRKGELYRGRPFWGGTVRLEGVQVREPIQLLTDQVNRDIKRKRLPVFRDLEYRPPLRIIGPNFVPKDRLHPQPEQATSA